MLERDEIERDIAGTLGVIQDYELAILVIQATAVRASLEPGADKEAIQKKARDDIARLSRAAKKEAGAALAKDITGLHQGDIKSQMSLYNRAFQAGIIQAKPEIPLTITALAARRLAGYDLFLRETMTRMERAGGMGLITIMERAISEKMAGKPVQETAIQAARLIQEEGIIIKHASGRMVQDPIAYARQNLTTAMAQHSASQQVAIADSMDMDKKDLWWETSSHMGARPEHEAWQGRVFKGWDEFVAATDYGQITGITGVNCRHSFYPFFPGVSQQTFTPYPTAANNKRYADLQAQRRIERNIRHYKTAEKVNKGLGNDALQARSAAKVKEWQARMLAHIKETGLTRRYARERIAAGRLSEPKALPGADIPAQATELKSIAQGGIIDEKKVAEALRKAEMEIKDIPDHEKGVIIGMNGDVLHVVRGSKNGLDFPTDWIKDNIITHNHPNDICIFSTLDIQSFVDYGGYEIRVVTQRGLFASLKQGAGALNTAITDDIIKANVNSGSILKKATRIVTDRAKRERRKYTSIEVVQEMEKIWAKWLYDNAAKYGYVFTAGAL